MQTLQPTYRLLIGVPGKSNAFAISRRLGLSEAILKQAKDTLSENDQNLEDVLSQLEQQRQEMEDAKAEMERLRAETLQQKQKSDEYYAQIRQEREKAVEMARAEANQIIEDARATANKVHEELRQMRKQLQKGADLSGYNAKQSELRRALNEAQDKLAEKRKAAPRPAATRAIRVGDVVELLKLGTRATVLACNKDGSYRLQAGILQLNAKPSEVYLVEQPPIALAKTHPKPSGQTLDTQASAGELVLRGMDSIEAISVLDQYLDLALRTKRSPVRIIHGKGTGALRAAVQSELRRKKFVRSFRLGVYGEGESGVTIAELDIS